MPAPTPSDGRSTGLSPLPRSPHLSVETVKTHVKHILAKPEVRDRTQAVVRAYRTGFAYRGPQPIPA